MKTNQLIPFENHLTRQIPADMLTNKISALADAMGFVTLEDFDLKQGSAFSRTFQEVIIPWFEKVVYARDLSGIRGMVIHSTMDDSNHNGRGVGKTMLASAAYRGLGYFYTSPTGRKTHLNLHWESGGYWFNGGGGLVKQITESPLNAGFIQRGLAPMPNRVVVIDDLTRATYGGADKVANSAQQALFMQTIKDVMDRINLLGMGFVITTNMTTEAFSQFVGASAYDRILEHSIPVTISGEFSHRIQTDAQSRRLLTTAIKNLG